MRYLPKVSKARLLTSGTFDWVVTGAVVSNFKIFATVKQETKASVTPQNVILTQNVIRIAAKCNTNAKCNNIDAKCNKIFNAECNNLSTQIVITFLTHNVITQNVIISE